jgi:phosphoribosylaminoimidazolecarboxamide formyltransferase/IMP cyclohydrolase
VAEAADNAAAYELAYGTDPTSAFGGIIAFNRTLDAATAKAILDRQFVEVLIAPDYEPGALDYAKKKANVRVLRIPHGEGRNNFDVKRVGSGLLMQTSDIREVTRDELKVVTKRAPTPAELADLLFAWRVAKYVKSNAIVYAKDGRTVGIGAGQMSRVVVGEDRRAQGGRSGLVGAGFGDGLRCVLPVPRRHRRGRGRRHPRGDPAGRFDARLRSHRAADEHGIAMVFTGIRHFRH